MVFCLISSLCFRIFAPLLKYTSAGARLFKDSCRQVIPSKIDTIQAIGHGSKGYSQLILLFIQIAVADCIFNDGNE